MRRNLATLDFTDAGLRRAGLSGFKPVHAEATDRCRSIPAGPGIYMVLRDPATAPRFRATSWGGRFKGRDPSVDRRTLREAWISESPVLYIGKTDELRKRVRQLVDFGGGRPIGHWGGRYLWQLVGSQRLLIAWIEDASPRATEMALIQRFVNQYGAMPYANLQA